jgi:predicted MFS family arabinose efflux permease
MAHEKLIHLLNFLWLLLVFPAVVAILVGFVSHSPTLGIKTFLLIEFGVAILSPLLTAIIWSRDSSHRDRGK